MTTPETLVPSDYKWGFVTEVSEDLAPRASARTRSG